MKTGYKVVRMGDYRSSILTLFSCSMFGRGSIIYEINKEARPSPKCGPLCVFNSKIEAIKFILNEKNDYLLFKCIYIPSIEHEVWVLNKIATQLIFLPEQTRLASSVTLIKEIKIPKWLIKLINLEIL
jgi:hypothetical protein